MNSLIPNQVLIYENVDGVIYAKYRDPPYNTVPRWIVGGDPDAVELARGHMLPYSKWVDLHELCEEYPELKKQFKKLITLYYIYKEEK